jgi:hypothetical protein
VPAVHHLLGVDRPEAAGLDVRDYPVPPLGESRL